MSSNSSVAIAVGSRLSICLSISIYICPSILLSIYIYLSIGLSIDTYLRGVGEQEKQCSDRRGRQARVRQRYLSIYLPIYQYIPPRGG